MMKDATQTLAASGPSALADFSDEQLLLRYRDAGDQDAFRELLHRYERELYSYLRRYLRDASLAEEVFQSTFLRVHEKVRLYEEGRGVRPWLYSIATHQAIDMLRKMGRRSAVSLNAEHGDMTAGGSTLLELLQDEGRSPIAQLELAERSAWARKAVDELPDHLREVVLLIYFQGLKFREAAEVLSIPLGTVKSRMHLALVRLNEAWNRSHRSASEE
jgi:RNA polymerase sigma-70 factor (ECF subfamily)